MRANFPLVGIIKPEEICEIQIFCSTQGRSSVELSDFLQTQQARSKLGKGLKVAVLKVAPGQRLFPYLRSTFEPYNRIIHQFALILVRPHYHSRQLQF
jgi:hypothetical protein